MQLPFFFFFCFSSSVVLECFWTGCQKFFHKHLSLLSRKCVTKIGCISSDTSKKVCVTSVFLDVICDASCRKWSNLGQQKEKIKKIFIVKESLNSKFFYKLCKIRRKHSSARLFFKIVYRASACTFIKKETPTQILVNLTKFLRIFT